MHKHEWQVEQFEQQRSHLRAVAYRMLQPFSVIGFTIVGSKIVEIDILSDPERLRHLDLSVFDK